MLKIKNGGLDQCRDFGRYAGGGLARILDPIPHQYGTEPFEQQQFGTAGTEGVNVTAVSGSGLLFCFILPVAGPGIFIWGL